TPLDLHSSPGGQVHFDRLGISAGRGSFQGRLHRISIACQAALFSAWSNSENGTSLRSSRLLRFAGPLSQRVYRVSSEAHIAFDQAAGQTDLDPIDFGCGTQPKMHSSIVIRSIA